MSVKMEIEWHLTSEKPHPDKPEIKNYEHVACFVLQKGMRFHTHDFRLLQWNCEHLCWDREDGDDHECDIDGVTAWAIVPTTKQILAAIGI